MYSSIDIALDKIEKQLRRHKDRLRNHKPTNGQAKMFKMGVLTPLTAPELEEESEFDSEFEEDYRLYPEPEVTEEEVAAAAAAEDSGEETVETPEGKVKVLRNQSYEAQAMKLEEAVLQLDLLEDRQFFVFTNSDTGAINVVYKREDQNIGLIET